MVNDRKKNQVAQLQSKNGSRVNVLQLLECCMIIQTIGHSVESVKSFSKGAFFSL